MFRELSWKRGRASLIVLSWTKSSCSLHTPPLEAKRPKGGKADVDRMSTSWASGRGSEELIEGWERYIIVIRCERSNLP